jgi:integrase
MIAVGEHHVRRDDTDRSIAYLINHFGKQTLLNDITQAKAEALVAVRRRDKVPHTDRAVGPYAVNRTLFQLKALFTYAKKNGAAFSHEPDWKSLWLKEPPQKQRDLRPDERARLIAAVRGDYAPLLAFAMSTGKRRTECVTVAWEHINWDTGWIVWTGKGGRTVSARITPEIRAILWPLQGHHPHYVFTYVATKDNPHLGRIRGNRYPITINGLEAYWEHLRRVAGLPGLRFHDLRHDFGMRFLRHTGNLELVRKAMNHSKISTTQRYAHALDVDVAEAMDAMAPVAAPPAKLRRVS